MHLYAFVHIYYVHYCALHFIDYLPLSFHIRMSAWSSVDAINAHANPRSLQSGRWKAKLARTIWPARSSHGQNSRSFIPGRIGDKPCANQIYPNIIKI